MRPLRGHNSLHKLGALSFYLSDFVEQGKHWGKALSPPTVRRKRFKFCPPSHP